MDETDFDTLFEGAPPQEAKQLRKMLAEWCQGDENSFPVQLALLTRAQWRAAASVPRLVAESRQQMEHTFTEHRRQTDELFDEFSGSVEDRIKMLEQIIAIHAAATKKAETEMRVVLTHAEAAAEHIRGELERGAVEWKKARRDFEAERQKLEKTRKEVETRYEWRDWACLLATAAALVMLGMVIGMHIRR
jgi:hypothetical protein